MRNDLDPEIGAFISRLHRFEVERSLIELRNSFQVLEVNVTELIYRRKFRFRFNMIQGISRQD